MQRAIAYYLPAEMALLGLIDAVLSVAAVYVTILVTGATSTASNIITIVPQDRIVFAAALTLTASAAGLAIGLYRIDVCLDRRRLLVTTGLAAIIAYAVLLCVARNNLTGVADVDTLFAAKILGAWLGTVTLIRVAYGSAAGRMGLLRRVLVVGNAANAMALHARLRSGRGGTYHAVTLPMPNLSWEVARAQRLWGIVVTSDATDSAVAPFLSTLLDCKRHGLKVLSGAAFHENYLGRIDLDAPAAHGLSAASGFTTSRLDTVLKRLSDLLLSLGLLILALPLMTVAALAIRMDSAGPVLYRQQRIGQFGKPFTLFKFRSMNIDAEAGGKPRWAQQHDPRITRVGRFIRASRIDELPQLVNVLRGEMSLVGPRPERPHFVEQLAVALPYYRQRTQAKPGVTGWAQVNFPYGASIEDAREKLSYDLYYVKNRSFLLDMVILLSTVRVVLFGVGAR